MFLRACREANVIVFHDWNTDSSLLWVNFVDLRSGGGSGHIRVPDQHEKQVLGNAFVEKTLEVRMGLYFGSGGRRKT